MTCVAVPPDQATSGAYCVCCGKPARVPDAELYDGVRVRLGHVRNSRFGSGQVIPGTNCAKSRALRRAK